MSKCSALLVLTITLGACVDKSEKEQKAQDVIPAARQGDRARVEPGGSLLDAKDRLLTYVGWGKDQLPKWKTSQERAVEEAARRGRTTGSPLLDAYDDYRDKNSQRFFITQPPQSGFRAPAEYEPSQALMLRWTHTSNAAWKKLFGDIVQGAWGVVPILLMHRDAAHRTFLENELQALGKTPAQIADPTKIIWWEEETDAIWCRDYGPLSIVSTGTGPDAGKLSFVDFRYYHTRPHDDEIPTKLAALWGINVFRPDLDFEGGNFMNTSDGLCASTKGVIYYNPQLSQSAIEQIYEEYLGCEKTLFPAPMEGVIAHIDMFSKFSSDTHMLVAEYTQQQAPVNKVILDANAALFASTTNGSGQPITVTRIPMPSNEGLFGLFKIWRTYTNSTALTNGTDKVLLIPVYPNQNSYEADAMAAYAQAFPGWTQIKIDSDVVIPGEGAIHCITMQIPVGSHDKMEADPPDRCGAQNVECVTSSCGNVSSVGCCDGEWLRYCSSGGSMRVSDCSDRPLCGWNASQSEYTCETAGDEDPSGTNIKSCSVVTDAGVLDSSVDSGVPSTCGEVPEVGCCDEETLWYCLNGQLKYVGCHSNPSCGWDDKDGYYNCGTDGNSEPSGQHPMPCSGFFGDAGPPHPEAGIPQGCGDIPEKGCCDGEVMHKCVDGELRTMDCSEYPKCGWHVGKETYQCGTTGTEDPNGTYLKACPGSELDASTAGDAGASDAAAADAGSAGADLGSGAGDGSLDGGSDAGSDADPDGGCSCVMKGAERDSGSGLTFATLMLLFLYRRRRR